MRRATSSPQVYKRDRPARRTSGNFSRRRSARHLFDTARPHGAPALSGGPKEGAMARNDRGKPDRPEERRPDQREFPGQRSEEEEQRLRDENNDVDEDEPVLDDENIDA